ncbi:hypothetical protein [Poseidonocella sp. HB161398]|uniref:IS66 family transposase n=1 Tax=Poseidonocella sp. HB161398 TaxID=2320855 RepID=UPI0035164ECE
MSDAADLDLSVLPPEYRAAFEVLRAQAARVAELEEITRRQESLIAEMNQALYGKKSEKLSEDERQLAFEERGHVRHWSEDNGRVRRRSPSSKRRRWRRPMTARAGAAGVPPRSATAATFRPICPGSR